MIYKIKVKGELDQSWSDWLGNVQIVSERNEVGVLFTTLTVEITDQTILFGILDRIRDLNFDLVNVIRREDEQLREKIMIEKDTGTYKGLSY